MTPEEQRDFVIEKLERQRDAAILVATCLILGGLFLVGVVAFQAWR
jgi:hypothetical protein